MAVDYIDFEGVIALYDNNISSKSLCEKLLPLFKWKLHNISLKMKECRRKFVLVSKITVVSFFCVFVM
jgi:hypothetical protein